MTARKPRNIDIRAFNRAAWDKQVTDGNRWSIPVDAATIAKARQGEFSILLTEQKPVPAGWFPPLNGADVLCLASGGGQQAPILAAAGANVTVLDNSPLQLERDRQVAEREGLSLRIVEGDAANLGIFPENSFDLVFNPVSTVFMAEVRPVWLEAFRVLKPGGTLLTGFMNPIFYLFEWGEGETELVVKHKIPYSDAESLHPATLKRYERQGLPLEFGHSLTDLIGGQLDAGFVVTGFYEDYMNDEELSEYHPVYIATKAQKPK
jgi:SAM-dependent methyltransferase